MERVRNRATQVRNLARTFLRKGKHQYYGVSRAFSIGDVHAGDDTGEQSTSRGRRKSTPRLVVGGTIAVIGKNKRPNSKAGHAEDPRSFEALIIVIPTRGRALLP